MEETKSLVRTLQNVQCVIQQHVLFFCLRSVTPTDRTHSRKLQHIAPSTRQTFSAMQCIRVLVKRLKRLHTFFRMVLLGMVASVACYMAAFWWHIKLHVPLVPSPLDLDEWSTTS